MWLWNIWLVQTRVQCDGEDTADSGMIRTQDRHVKREIQLIDELYMLF